MRPGSFVCFQPVLRVLLSPSMSGLGVLARYTTQGWRLDESIFPEHMVLAVRSLLDRPSSLQFSLQSRPGEPTDPARSLLGT